MKVLIVGSGGREHAIAWAVNKSDKADKIYCAPGNAGIAEYAECVNIGAMEFDKLVAFAKEKGTDVLLEGSNEDDMHVYRPGRRAIEELKVHSPLALCHFTKEEVRYLAAEYGISVAKRPSAPCLATRLPYGTEIDLELLKRIEQAEEYLKSFISGNVRVRVHGNILRLEVDAEAMEGICRRREEILTELKKVGVPYITLDMEGFRSGSMDIV